MNYEQRSKLQAKLKVFTDDEIAELKSCVIEKEFYEREENKTKQRMRELYD